MTSTKDAPSGVVSTTPSGADHSGAADGAATDCVRLAVLSIAWRFSKLVADGGWLRETEAELRPRHVPAVLDEALRRIAAQMPQAEKLRYADYALDTSGTLEDTLARTRALWGELTARSASRSA